MNDSNVTIGPVWLYGGDVFGRFSAMYDPVHLPLSLLICLLGISANALNVIVLTRRSMITPTNIILTGLSVAQLFLLTNYLLLLIFNVCARTCLITALHSYPAVTYKWINVNLSVAFHTTALCHTLVLAVFRFLAIKLPTFARTSLNVRNSRLSVSLLHLVVPLLCAPTFFTSYVAASKQKQCDLDTVYDLDYSEKTYLLEAAMWKFGIFFKLVPSLMIVILSFYLIVSLKKYNEKKAQLTGKHLRVSGAYQSRWSTMEGEPTEGYTGQRLIQSSCDHKNTNKKRNARRSLTKMLVIVALLCVCVELPHGIVNLLTAVFGQEFGMEVYDNLGDLFEMLTLLYSSVNFILYCAMSTEFQNTFWALFCVPLGNALLRMLGKPASLEKPLDPNALLSRRTSCVD